MGAARSRGLMAEASKRVFFFYCDDCLYKNDWKTAGRLTEKIANYCEVELGLAKGRPYELYKQYGTCLRGLMEEKIIEDSEEAIATFLEAVHDISYEEISPDPELRAMLLRVNITRWVFTASVEGHCRRCLAALGIEDVFK